jgi:hypothetical protein
MCLPLNLALVALLIAGGLLLRQLNRWERVLPQGDSDPPRFAWSDRREVDPPIPRALIWSGLLWLCTFRIIFATEVKHVGPAAEVSAMRLHCQWCRCRL